MLDSMVFVALKSQQAQEAQQLVLLDPPEQPVPSKEGTSPVRLIRKSDSVSAIIKVVNMKALPIWITSSLALNESGLSRATAFLVMFGGLLVYGAITKAIFVPLATQMYNRKSSRDDAL